MKDLDLAGMKKMKIRKLSFYDDQMAKLIRHVRSDDIETALTNQWKLFRSMYLKFISHRNPFFLFNLMNFIGVFTVILEVKKKFEAAKMEVPEEVRINVNDYLLIISAILNDTTKAVFVSKEIPNESIVGDVFTAMSNCFNMNLEAKSKEGINVLEPIIFFEIIRHSIHEWYGAYRNSLGDCLKKYNPQPIEEEFMETDDTTSTTIVHTDETTSITSTLNQMDPEVRTLGLTDTVVVKDELSIQQT